MTVFLTAGILYLIGVAVVLVWKPSLMFTEKGEWKEFGIGRNPATHTWMPIWLFIILWAIISFILAGLFHKMTGSKASPVPVAKPMYSQETIDTVEEVTPEELTPSVPKGRRKNELKAGYYILNREGTQESGVPKYVYLGPELA